MSAQSVADAGEREHALDPRRSFIVQAPAGSGKTELLVRRFVRLLSTVRRPEEVLAITFTRKAAAEMKKRVLAALGGAPEIAPRLRIMTIDALCSTLTRQMPVVAKFGAQPAIVESEQAQQLYRTAAARTLARLEEKGQVSRHVAQLLVHLDNDLVEAQRLLASMLARRDQWLRRAGDPPTRAELEAAFGVERERLLARAQALHPAASPEFAEQVLTKSTRQWRKRPKPAPADLVGNEALRLALSALFDLPPATYAEEQWQVLEAIFALLKLAAAELKLLFGERGQADFTEYAQAAVMALGSAEDPSELLLRMDASLSHVLVDEFQDTSVSQWQLLERLTAGWEAGDGRTVFVVGDPMQSIYRFREAEVGLFLHARCAGLGGLQLESLRLKTSFRSQAGVVEWVNASFTRVLPAEEDESSGAVPYSLAAPHPEKPRREGAAATWHVFSDAKTARRDEARRVLELARSAGEAGSSCAILVRNRRALAEIVPALQGGGLRFRALEIEHLGEKQVVQDLYALVRALVHPADRIAWLALLRARWCGLMLSDLHALAGNGSGAGEQASASVWELMQEERLAAVSPDGRARLKRLRAVLGPALGNALRGTLRERVEGTWLALGGPACLGDRTELEDAEIFFDCLDRLEDAGDIENLEALAASLKELYALPDVQADETALQIMTVHRAKGLEFDTVILPGLDRSPRSGERPLMAWKLQSDGRLLLAPINASGDDGDALFRYVRERLREAEDLEAGRLLYVATTRARERLHLLACVKCDEEGREIKPPRRSLLALMWPVLAAGAEYRAPAEMAAGGHVPLPGSQRGPLRLPSSWQHPPLPQAVAWQAAADVARAAEVIEFSWAGETARHIGSVAHRWLQRIAEEALQGWSAERVAGMRNAFGAELAARGIAEPALGAAAERVADALLAALADERGRWLLGPQEQARNEYRLTAFIAGERRQLVIDRTFVAGGKRWIVDYKTGSHEGADVEAFLDQECKRYREQLERYALALAPGEAATLGLYFPLLGGWRDWDKDHRG